MGDAYVVAEADVEGVRLDGDTALVKTTIGREQGSERLEQRVVRLAPGRAQPRRDDDRDVVLYVVAGRGTLEVDGEPHRLEPGTGAYVAAGETRQVDNPGPEELVIVAVLAPASPLGTDGGRRRVTVRFDDQPELRADSKRTFRYLVNQDAGCRAVTQFVGLVETHRAPDHSHAYDEVGYVVAGHGFAHADGRAIPIGPGSCFHLPPQKVHCIENSGPGLMQILGVFHPAGDPASRSYDAVVPRVRPLQRESAT